MARDATSRALSGDSSRSVRVRTARIAAALLSPLLLLLLAEAALHAAGFRFDPSEADVDLALGGELLRAVEAPEGILMRHPARIWTPRPGGSVQAGSIHHAINRQGMVGPVLEEPRPPGGFRVLCVGDSSTFGVRADPERVFARLLEERLAKSLPGRRVEVANGGVPGYTVAQGLHRLRELLPLLRPDAVVLMCGALNEQHPAAKLSDEDWIRTLGTGPAGRGALSGSRLWQFLRKVRSGVRRPYIPGSLDELAAGGFRVLDARGEPTLGRRVPRERFGPLLEEACAVAEASGARAVVVVPPVPPEGPAIRLGARNLWRRDLYERFCGDCEVAGGRPGRVLVDAAALFEESGGASLFADDVHPNEAGHAQLALALEGALLPLAAR